jgi:hypothetical protein
MSSVTPTLNPALVDQLGLLLRADTDPAKREWALGQLVELYSTARRWPWWTWSPRPASS